MEACSLFILRCSRAASTPDLSSMRSSQHVMALLPFVLNMFIPFSSMNKEVKTEKIGILIEVRHIRGDESWIRSSNGPDSWRKTGLSFF